MLNTAKDFISQVLWMALWPGLAIFLLMLSLICSVTGCAMRLTPRRS
jgi:ABC-type dipeptide/oligopeptide/nickel transport system permease subunit